MSADDQAFLDILSSVPNDIKRYSSEVADYVDRHLEHASNVLRETLSSSPWIPEPVRPRRPSPPPKAFIESTAVKSTYTQIHNWVMRHKVWTTVIVLVAGGVTYHFIRRKLDRKKRRATRARNGARLEVVVIAGSPSEPLTRSISLDLERRGFIVYIVCNTIEEEVLVQNESRPDIKPLMIDIVDPASGRASINRFTAHLQTPHTAFTGARAHYLSFRSLIVIPSTTFPTGPIASLQPSMLSDLLNTRLLTPILTLQTFLPLLTSPPFPRPQLHANSLPIALQAKPSVLILTPNIIPSLNPAFHLPESSITAALTSLSSVLSSELSPLGLPVIHLQLGHFDLSAFTPYSKHPTLQAQRAETLLWDESARQAYAGNFVAASFGGFGVAGDKSGRGSSLRELNDAVFDAMLRKTSGVVTVGMGSRIYGFIGRWAPSGLVGWMMGMRSVRSMDEGHCRKGIEFGRLLGAAEGSSGASTPMSGSNSGRSANAGPAKNFDGVGERLGESSFVAIDGEMNGRDRVELTGVDRIF